MPKRLKYFIIQKDPVMECGFFGNNTSTSVTRGVSTNSVPITVSVKHRASVLSEEASPAKPFESLEIAISDLINEMIPLDEKIKRLKNQIEQLTGKPMEDPFYVTASERNNLKMIESQNLEDRHAALLDRRRALNIKIQWYTDELNVANTSSKPR